jgi:hypothetical protein
MKSAVSFDEWADQCLVDRSLMTGVELARLHANFLGRSEPNDADFAATAPLLVASAASDPVAVEERRLAMIERVRRRDWSDDNVEQVDELCNRTINGELSIDELLVAVRPISTKFTEAIPMASATHIPRGLRASQGKIIEAAFAISCGLPHVEKTYDEQTLDACDSPDLKNFGLQELLLFAASQNGFRARPGTSINAGNVREVLMYAMPSLPIRAEGFATISIPNILSNVANKFLKLGFDSVDQTCLKIAFIANVSNFKQRTTISLIGGMDYGKVGPDGELKSQAPGEVVYTNQADTYGVICQITRQDIINDDLSALNRTPTRIGRGGMLKLNDLFWTIFLNNASFFTSGNKNVSTGAGSALSFAGLSAAEVVFLNQLDPDNNPLGVMPAILLVPPTQRTTAFQLMQSTTLIGSINTTTGAVSPSGNVFNGRYNVESSPYMENTKYTGYSSSAWYLLASAAQLAVIEIAALNGRVEPTVETAMAEFSNLGISMRGYSDVGVALQEYRGGVRSAGS